MKITVRRKNDYYPTPGKAVLSLIKHCPSLADERQALEPCCGDGAIANVLKARFDKVMTTDIDDRWIVDQIADARYLKVAPGTAVITNPPFNQALPIVSNFVKQGVKCAFLLRLSFLEPTKERGVFLKRYPPAGLISIPRISFTGDGKTDSVSCAWMVWNVPKFGIKVVSKQEFHSN